ncbi:MAG: sulfatase [Planctomycetota bacterium]
MKQPPRPNVILINCDDLGYGDLGCYGSSRNSTQNLDRLAHAGTRFTDFYMASPVCSPSRGAMLTGCYPPRIGFDLFGNKHVLFPGDPFGLADTEQTFASLLRDAGYATALVGKWHCGDQPPFLPTRHGFDHYFGLPYSNDMGRQIGERSHMPPLPLIENDTVVEQQPDMSALTERYVAEARRFITANRDQPFLLYFAHMYVHLPLIVPERFLKRSDNGRYGAAVAVIDWAMGVLMQTLEKLGLADNTLILFTSDNGSRVNNEGGSNGPLRGAKGSTEDGGMRLPLIAHWPGHVPANRTCNTLCSSIDLLPTLVNLAGAESPSLPIDGVDLTPTLLGDDDHTPREHFAYFRQNQLQAVRNQRYKLCLARGKAFENEPLCELYDLHEDIGETRDIAEQHPDVVQRLKQVADQYNAELGPEGSARRPSGKVDNPQPLTVYDADYPYFAAEYDLGDAG